MVKTILFVFIYGASPLTLERELHRTVRSMEECNAIKPIVREELNRQKKNYLLFCRDVPA
jgi:hypothetical protein